MKTWLKLIGSAKTPIKEWKEDYVGFRKERKPSLHKGDRLFLYATGGSKRIFAEAEAVGEIEQNSNFNLNIDGSCRWNLSVNYKVNLLVDDGILIEDVVCDERDLRLSLRQASHVRLLEEEIRLIEKKLEEK